MSYIRAKKNIRMQTCEGLAYFENLDHPKFMEELIGYDPWTNPQQAYADSYKALDMDWVIGLPNRTVKIAPGESCYTDVDGTIYTEWGMSGSAWREEFLFHDMESILAYNPIENLIGEKLVSPQYTQDQLDRRQADQDLLGDSAIVTSIYYTTLFQFGIMIFDWELFLMTARTEPDRFQRVLEGFAEVSRRNITKWAEGPVDLILMHDDIAMERGMVFHPAWYRKNLFPLYEYILEPLKNHKDLKIAFVSDGNYNEVLDDLVAIGFDGFMINSPAMDLGEIAKKLGDKVFLAGGIDTNILTLGRPEDVEREVKVCIEKVKPARGFFMHSGGDLPHNIPLENLHAYFSTTRELKTKI